MGAHDEVMNIFATIGAATLAFLASVGRLSRFTGQSVLHCIAPPIFLRLIGRQMWRIGYASLPVVGLTAFFTGAVLALQIYIGGSRFNAEGIVANIVVLGITRELGPVLAGLMVAGRVSAAIAAEIGTMRVTEQIDALTTLSTNPFKYLIAPRLIAAVICLPILVAIADTIGVMGGFIVSTENLGFNPAVYLKNTVDFLEFRDVTSGLYKSAAFGFIIALMGCYHGYYSEGGAQGVGKATTNAVVSASILILAANYLLTSTFFFRVSIMTSVPKISLRDVHKAFGPKKVLQGVNLDVLKGSSLVVIGGSGTGKSVMLKSILGLLRPDSGSIKVDGKEVTTMSAREREKVLRKFGMLFQGAALFDSLPVWGKCRLWLDPRTAYETQRRERDRH